MEWLTTFCVSWRAHLVGSRRVWHPHHYFNVCGQRDHYLIARPSAQILGLSRSINLLESIFSRGGRIWGFGIFSAFVQRPWGFSWPEWLPGQLTNSIFQRDRKNYFLIHSTTFQRRRRRRRRFLKRLRRSTRRSRRRLFFNPAKYSGIMLRENNIHRRKIFTYARGAYRYKNNQPRFMFFKRRNLFLSLTSFLKKKRFKFIVKKANQFIKYTNRPGRLALKKHRLKTNVVKIVFKRLKLYIGKPVFSTGRSVKRLAPTVTKKWRLAKRRRQMTKRRDRFPTSDRPFRQSTNYQAVPFKFPSVIVAVGLDSKRSLLTEANSTGIPVIYFHNSGVSPNLSPFGVIWGTTGFQPRGIHYLLTKCYQRVWTTCFLNTVWSRVS